EGEHAQDQVREAAEAVDAPAAPGPDLRGDQVHDLAVAFLGDLTDGRVGRGGIDGEVDRDGVVAEPGVDAGVDAVVVDDLLDAGHAHDRIVAGALDDGGPGPFHLWAAPGVDREAGVAAAEFLDHGGRVFVAAGLEGGEEQAAARGGRLWHGGGR